jgi:ribosome-dependent ATPase
MQFSGFLKPVSSLSGSARVMGQVFPSTYFQQISIGAFTKALGFADLTISMVALGALVVGYLLITLARLKTQEG